MTRDEIIKVIESEQYNFLRTNPHLKDRILFLCLGGSHSYGTNIASSDLDIRGVTLDSEDDILGITSFEQFQNEETDTVIYSFTKFIKLVSDCNPNVIEMLFCEEDHYFYVSPLGRYILDNKHIFLSQKAKYTFGGYAHAQLNRLENALCRNGDVLTPLQTQEHINRSVSNLIMTFTSRYNIKEYDVKTYIDTDDSGNPSIYCNFNLKKCPLGNVREMIEQMTNILRDYSKSVGPRGKKKDDQHLNKHMMHLIRLYLMACEIFEDNTLHTYRHNDISLLMSIRNGEYRNDNGSVKDSFYELLSSLEERLEEAIKTTSIPKKVQKEKIDSLVRYVIKKGVFNNEI